MNAFRHLLTALLLAAAICQADEATSAPVSIDTGTNGVVIIQSGSGLAHSPNWCLLKGATSTIVADGLPATPTAGVSNYQIYSGSDSGLYTWDYADVSPETLPRESYQLTHRIYDSDSQLLGTLYCTVQLTPEPAFLAVLLPLMALALRRDKR